MSEMIGWLHYGLPEKRFYCVASMQHMSKCVMRENKEVWAQQIWDGAGSLQSGEIQSLFSLTHVAHKAKYS